MDERFRAPNAVALLARFLRPLEKTRAFGMTPRIKSTNTYSVRYAGS